MMTFTLTDLRLQPSEHIHHPACVAIKYFLTLTLYCSTHVRMLTYDAYPCPHSYLYECLYYPMILIL